MIKNILLVKLRIIGLGLSFFIMQPSTAQIGYCRINGIISNENFKDVAYLIKGNKPHLDLDFMEIVDTFHIKNGKFSFNIPISYTDYYSIKLKLLKKGFAFICSPKANLKIKIDTSDFYHPVISGSKENVLSRNGIIGRDPLIKKMNSYADSASHVRNDSVRYNKYASLNDYWANEIKLYNLNFIKKNPNCLTSLSIYNTYYKIFSKGSIRKYLKNLPIALQKNPLTKEIYFKKIILESELKKITKFYDLKFYDTLNRLFDFNSSYNKLVLIDFWASWCKPCIANFSLLKKIETAYKDKNFIIIGVSLDDNFKRWKNEIKRSGLTWSNISDLKGANGLGARYLNVTTIPRYILISKNGSIINDNVKDGEIEKLIIANLN